MLAAARQSVGLAARAAAPARLASARFASNVATFDLDEDSFKLHKLEDGPPLKVEVEKDEAWALFREMTTIRRLETTASELYRSKKIRGFCHLYSGQEAVCTGLVSELREQDSIITAYRCHGWALSLGHTATAVFGELFGNSAGCSNGKGGSMHMYGERFYGGNGIVGAQVPVGAGIAMAHQYLNDEGVCFSFYGDGASNQGQVFEAYNIAKLWKLPSIFVCENNQYGMGTHDYRSSASTSYYTRGDYIPGIWVNGMDVLAVKSATDFAIEYAKTNGPLVMEMHTYRYHGHSMSDPDTTYRTRDDIKSVRETRDPILLLRKRMVEAEFATEDELKAAEKEIRASVKKSSEEALAAPPTDMSQLTKDIYVEDLKNVRGCDPFTFH